MNFIPDYTNMEQAARNIYAPRLPLYEHIISPDKMEEITGKSFSHLHDGDYADKLEYFKHVCDFFVQMGYDTVSFECCVSGVMPDAGCLGQHVESKIKCRQDFEKYPWDELTDMYFKEFDPFFMALREALPPGMKAIGGVGNGIFECVQEIIGYMNLCYFSVDDPELYADFFAKTGEAIHDIWEKFLPKYGDMFAVLRMGDDLGYKSGTLLPTDDIRNFIVPGYAKIVEVAHRYNKPFLLHSCGAIYDVMADIIDVAKIDAKHSNEDAIALFPEWVDKYGDRIGNFGGIDTDALCRLSRLEVREYVNDTLERSKGRGGIAFGSGNSIPDYVPAENYLEMVNTVRRYRGEKI